jgi:hypothetical protein
MSPSQGRHGDLLQRGDLHAQHGPARLTAAQRVRPARAARTRLLLSLLLAKCQQGRQQRHIADFGRL